MDSIELRAVLAQHNNGTEQTYTHPLHKKVIYSEGFRAFAQNAGNGAYWLLDILATQPEILEGVRRHGFCVVVLEVAELIGNTAVLTVARDYSPRYNKDDVEIGGSFDQIVYQLGIDHTDCPVGVWKFYYQSGDPAFLSLPSEY